MKKLAAAALLFFSFSLSAQTLFYYGKDSVSVGDFMAAYEKNNTGKHSEQNFKDYLQLYINSRLKIQEARAKGYDTLPQLISDLNDLRQQILPSYLNDKAAVDRLVAEARERGKKDIHLAHIFLATAAQDSTAAITKLREIQDQLAKGTSFADLARRYSNDPSARDNGGDLGWITVFSLPYEFETLAYTLPLGSVSTAYRSKSGYHLFYKMAERPDPGHIRAAQILLAFPPGTDAAGKKKIGLQADSIYAQIKKGRDFGKLAAQFSNDVISSAADGQMQEFGVGQYDPAFEKQVFGLARDGDVSKPFLTAYGYHIVKRLKMVPRAEIEKDPRQSERLREKVEQSDRMNAVKAQAAEKIARSVQVKQGDFNSQELWAYTDSLINNQVPAIPVHITPSTRLLFVKDRMYTSTDWIAFTQVYRYMQDGSGVKSYPVLWSDFVQAKSLEYYQDHLEDYNEAFRQQVNEFREGNLFFEIMQREVWTPAQNDSLALEAYYKKNRDHYRWKPSADAAVFYSSDAAAMNSFKEQLRKRPSAWKELVANYSEKVAADSARVEIDHLPNPAKANLKPGMITGTVQNATDNTVSFAYIFHVYSQSAARSFAEARGLVINDYQGDLEQRWIASLRSKYPVRINDAAWQQLLRKKQY